MHYETITNEMKHVLDRFSSVNDLCDNFYLAGGTGLALQLGHRKSIDLDFFSENSFNIDRISSIILSDEDDKITQTEEGTIHAIINKVKVSLLFYPYPLLDDFQYLNRIRIAAIEDIACMKTIAVSQRAERKDFFDMYEIMKVYSPSYIKDMLIKKYGANRINCYHILKSFFYFDDAEESLNPVSLNNTDWETVKQHFIKNEKIIRKALDCD